MTAPWTAGRTYARGEAFTLSADVPIQVDVRTRWPDGSIQHCVVSALGPAVIQPGEPVPGEPVAEPSAAWLAENVVVMLTGDGVGAYYPVPEVSAWDRSKPHKVREVLGPIMSEFHYYAPTSDPHLALWWHLRCYASGSVEVETVVENGWLNVPGPTDKHYGLTITIGGQLAQDTEAAGFPFWHTPTRKSDSELRFPAASVKGYFLGGRHVRIGGQRHRVVAAAYVAGGTTVTVEGVLPASVASVFIEGHVHHTRWSRVDWIGPAGVPQPHLGGVLPKFYDADGAPDARVLEKLPVPEMFERGAFPRTMGASGSNAEPVFQPAAFYVKTGDARAYASTIAHGRVAGRYAIHYRDETTGEPARYGQYPKHGVNGVAAGFTSTKLATGTLRFPTGGIAPPVWAKTHAPQLALVPYLLEGRQSFRDEIEFQAQVAHWCANTRTNTFEGERIANGGTSAFALRGSGWALRSCMEALLALPEGHPRAEQYARQLGKTLAYYDQHFTGQNAFGMVQPNTGYSDKTLAYTASASFQGHFLTIGAAWALQNVGHRLLEEDRPRAEAFTRWRLSHVVGLNGTADGWCYRYAAVYDPVYAIGNVANADSFTPAEFNAACLPSWKDAFEATARLKPSSLPAPEPCDSRPWLMKTGSANPYLMTKDPGSNWAINMAALAFAVEYAVPGAAEAWARFTGADNYAPTGFRNLPDWGIVPRWH